MSHIFKKLKTLMHTYSHAWVLLYAFIYFPWFTYLERHVTDNYFVIHSIFDDYIPFCEYFIIPYLLWFAYIAVTLGYLFFNDKQGFYKASAIMFSGMTIFLIICTVFPNGLNLRPEVFTRDNFCIELVKRIYQTDTPTNVLPSLHVLQLYLLLHRNFPLREASALQTDPERISCFKHSDHSVNHVPEATFRSGCSCCMCDGIFHVLTNLCTGRCKVTTACTSGDLNTYNYFV